MPSSIFWSMRYTIALSVLATTGLLISRQVAAQNLSYGIKLTRFEVTHPDENTTKLVMAATGSGIAVGSYFIRLDDFPPSTRINNIYDSNGNNYVNGGTSDKPSPNLLDNGEIDEDRSAGTFSYTFHTQNWPDGRYVFLAGAQNRPAGGAYITSPHGFVITKGNVAPLKASNIPTSVHRVVYKKEGVYAVFPDLFILPDGRIGTSFGTRVYRSHIDNAGGALSLISADEGKTWKKAEKPLVDQKWRTTAGLLVAASARGWINTDSSNEADLKKQNKIIMNVRPGVIAYLGGAESRTSNDGGRSWQTRKIATPKGTLGLMNYLSYASEITTSKNIRLRTVYGYRLKHGTRNIRGNSEVFLLRSTNDGKSWSCLPMYPKGLPDTKIGFNETTIAEAADGTIVALMRSDPEGYLWQARSTDGGLTWSKAVQTRMWGSPGDIIRLKDGRLLAVHTYRRAPMGIRAELSQDNGKTWDVEHELIIRQDGLGNPSDLGYPLAYELPDGRIFCIYYMTVDEKNTYIASTTFKLEEFPKNVPR